jgi:hypothetical protein
MKLAAIRKKREKQAAAAAEALKPKRLGLADLKRAALERKAAQAANPVALEALLRALALTAYAESHARRIYGATREMATNICRKLQSTNRIIIAGKTNGLPLAPSKPSKPPSLDDGIPNVLPPVRRLRAPGGGPGGHR